MWRRRIVLKTTPLTITLKTTPLTITTQTTSIVRGSEMQRGDITSQLG
jgi:hypothetical protein